MSGNRGILQYRGKSLGTVVAVGDALDFHCQLQAVQQQVGVVVQVKVKVVVVADQREICFVYHPWHDGSMYDEV